jgi:hypothetical protein
MYPAATNEVVVEIAMLNVAAEEDVLHTVIVLTTVAVADGTVYSVSAVPIVPVDASAPSRLYTVAMIYAPISRKMSATLEPPLEPPMAAHAVPDHP